MISPSRRSREELCPAEGHSENSSDADAARWFCARTQPCRESFAHSFLQQIKEVESFLPRIRFRGTGRRRKQWIVEPLFPGYLFCKFDWRLHTRTVTYSPGVSGLIHFGLHYPVIPPEVIQELQQTFGTDEATTIDRSVRVGDRAIVQVGPMRGVEGVVCRVLPNKGRVAVLMEFLGQQTQIEIDVDHLEIPDRLNLRTAVSVSSNIKRELQ